MIVSHPHLPRDPPPLALTPPENDSIPNIVLDPTSNMPCQLCQSLVPCLHSIGLQSSLLDRPTEPYTVLLLDRCSTPPFSANLIG